MTEPENPYAAPAASIAPSLTQAAPNDRSMFAQILVVGILQTVVGGMELLLGGAYVAMAIVIPMSLRAASGAAPGEAFSEWMIGLIYGGIGGGAMISGCLRLASGISSFYFRNRLLMLISLVFGLVSTFTCYCALTAAPLAIYGMIVMFSPAAKRAFAMRKAGMSPTEIRRAFGG